MAQLSKEFTGTSRFQVIRKLGEGGMGCVYEALDREKNVHVALKTILHFSGEALLRFKNEFRALHEIEHENLVRLGEFVEDDNGYFFTMELVRGVNFLEFVRGEKPNEPTTALSDELNPIAVADTQTPSGGGVALDATLTPSAAGLDGAALGGHVSSPLPGASFS